jgi:hypothetical protein
MKNAIRNTACLAPAFLVGDIIRWTGESGILFQGHLYRVTGTLNGNKMALKHVATKWDVVYSDGQTIWWGMETQFELAYDNARSKN